MLVAIYYSYMIDSFKIDGNNNNNDQKSPGISQQDLERLADILGLGLYKIDLQTGDIILTHNTARLTGHDINDLPNTEHTKESLIVDEDRDLVKHSMHSIISRETDHYHIEYRMHRKDSSIARFEEAGIVSDYAADGQPLCVSAMVLDLSRLKWAEEKANTMERELKRLGFGRDDSLLTEENRLLRAANSAAAMVIGGVHQNYDMVLIQSLQMLGESVHADYAGLWRNTERDGTMYCSRKYHWTEKGRAASHKEKNILYSYDTFLPGWKEKLAEKRYLICDGNKMSSEFLNALDIKNARSILLAPFYLHGSFWGMLGITRKENLPFSEHEAEALMIGATIIAFSVSRHEIFGKITLDREKALTDTLAKGEFLSRMSHEMRTPLNAIIGMTNIALREKNPQKIMGYLKKVEASSHLMLNIINDVLDMSKIEAGKLEINKEPFDFSAMLKNAENIVRVKMDEKQQRFTLHCDESITRMIISDELRLLQVIVNLLNNAMKFTQREGTIKLNAFQRKIGKDRLKIRVEVCDNGVGLSQEQQKKLFTAFEQADGSITRTYGGTGLGLAICKKILNALGGDIWVKSKPDHGACFFFELEADAGHPIHKDECPISAQAIQDAAEKSHNWEKYTILLAEDNDINREIIEISLSKTAINIVSVENGKEAIEMLSTNPERYALVLMDIHMPVMDGLSATKQIRALDNPHAKQIPIIAMTANAFKEDIDTCIKAGMNEHVAKPIAMNIFFEVLEKYLR